MSRFGACCIQLPAYSIDDPVDHWPEVLDRIDEALLLEPRVIVLPECTYPAYFLKSRPALRQGTRTPTWSALEAISRKAAQGRCLIAIGLVEEEGEAIYNSAFLVGSHGGLVGRCRKSFLWHFDRGWFSPGVGWQTYDTELGSIGMLICADGRMPEIARILAVQGAQILLNPTAWVSSGATMAELSNPQFDLLMPMRAIENGLWVLSANKHGVEAQSIVYCGKSCIIDPQGRKRAVAGTDQTEIICAEVDLDDGRSTTCLDGRHPHAYWILSEPTRRLPAFRKISLPARADNTLSVSALQIPGSNVGQYLGHIETLGEVLAPQDVDLAVCPALEPGLEIAGTYDDAQREETTQRIGELAARTGTVYLVELLQREGDRLYKAAAFISPEGLVGEYRQVHLRPDERTVFTPGSSLTSICNIKGADVGVLMSTDMYLPESARCLMLAGADLIVWMNYSVLPYDMVFLRGRALENRVYMVHADSVSAEKPGISAIVSPEGQIMARALQDRELAISAQIFYPLARNKNMAPNTNALLGRMPEAYSLLTQQRPEEAGEWQESVGDSVADALDKAHYLLGPI